MYTVFVRVLFLYVLAVILNFSLSASPPGDTDSGEEISSSYSKGNPNDSPSQEGRLGPKRQKTDNKRRPSIEDSHSMSENSIEPNLKEEFLQFFDVGQGSSAYAKIRNTGILYDCGTSGTTIHKKILRSRTRKNVYELFLERQALNERDLRTLETLKVSETEEDLADDLPNFEEMEMVDNSIYANDSVPARLSNEDEGSILTWRKGTKESESVDGILHIKNVIANSGLKRLFIIVSHPDRDHFNRIRDVVPSDVEAFFLICGNFLHMKNSHSSLKGDTIEEETQEEKDTSNKERKDLLSFISQRIADNRIKNIAKTYFSFPYYWNYEQYKDIHASITDGNVDRAVSIVDESLPGVPPTYYGKFIDFLHKAHAFDQTHKISENASLEPLFSEESLVEDLGKVFIWSANKFSSDTNRQSPIVSISLEKLKVSCILTGDAHEDVFGDIEDPSKPFASSLKSNLDQYVWKGGEHTVFLALPHHGSVHNKSLQMINLFQPHALVASGGGGRPFCHPSFDLVADYQHFYSEKRFPHLYQKVKDFWKRYNPKLAYSYLSYSHAPSAHKKKDKKEQYNQKDGEEAAFTHSSSNTSETATLIHSKETREIRAHRCELADTALPILATHLSGSILITEEGVMCEYFNGVLLGKERYRIEFKTSLPHKRVELTENGLLYTNATGDEPNLYVHSPENENYYINEEEKRCILRVVLGKDGADKYYLGKLEAIREKIGTRFYYVDVTTPIIVEPLNEITPSVMIYEGISYEKESGNSSYYLSRESSQYILYYHENEFYRGTLEAEEIDIQGKKYSLNKTNPIKIKKGEDFVIYRNPGNNKKETYRQCVQNKNLYTLGNYIISEESNNIFYRGRANHVSIQIPQKGTYEINLTQHIEVDRGEKEDQLMYTIEPNGKRTSFLKDPNNARYYFNKQSLYVIVLEDSGEYHLGILKEGVVK